MVTLYGCGEVLSCPVVNSTDGRAGFRGGGGLPHPGAVLLQNPCVGVGEKCRQGAALVPGDSLSEVRAGFEMRTHGGQAAPALASHGTAKASTTVVASG